MAGERGGASGIAFMKSLERSSLLLMRCGATEWDRLGRVQGAADLPLCDGGRADVVAEVQRLEQQGVRLSRVVTAPDEASRETARTLARATGGKIVVEPGLRDLALGLWEGLRWTSLESKYWAGRVFLEGEEGVTAPGAEESLGAFRVRVLKAFDRVIAKRKRDMAVVVRPMALGVMKCHLGGIGLDGMREVVEASSLVEWHVGQAPMKKSEPMASPARAKAAADARSSVFLGRAAAAL